MIWAHQGMKRKARLEHERQPAMPPRLGMLDAVVGQRVMAQQGGAVRKRTVYRTPNRRLSLGIRSCPLPESTRTTWSGTGPGA